MGDWKEDWDFEIDTLKSIYLEQFKQLEEHKKFEITIWPNPDAGEDENTVGVQFIVQFKPNYPDELPNMVLKPLRGVTNAQCKSLLEELKTQGEDLLGMEMIFNLSQYIKEWLDDQNMDALDKKKEASKAQEELDIERERAEYSRKYVEGGTTVTREVFISWFQSFLDSHPEKYNPRVEEVTSTKRTGRQIFEQAALAGISLETMEDKEEDVDWELFSKEGEIFDEEE